MTQEATPLLDATLRKRAALASISLASTLILAKLVAFFITDSIALLSSLIDSSMDLMASLVTAYAIKTAMTPPDENHRFGHGKAESLAALMQATFILGAAALLAIEAVERLASPRQIQQVEVGFYVTGGALILTTFLVGYQRYVIRKTGSMAISADSLHYATDLVTNLAVGLALALQNWTGQSWIDPAFGLGVALFMSWGAASIARGALKVLMDEDLPLDERAKILALAKAEPGVLGVHDLRTRSDSDRLFIELHIELAPSLTVLAAHDIAEKVELRLKTAFPNADVMIHQDPAGIDEPRLDVRIAENATS